MSSSTNSTRSTKVTSHYHRGTVCGPCFICGREDEKNYNHFDGLRHEVQQFLAKHVGHIPGNSCICRAHCREAERQHLNPEYVPIWKKNKAENVAQQTQHVCTCMYKECAVTSEKEKFITSSHESFRKMLGTTEQLVVLCEKHYQLAYRQIHGHKQCAACGAKPKFRQDAYIRHSPDPITVSQYLSEHTEFSVSLLPTDCICKSCYDIHIVILKSLEEQPGSPQQNLQSDIDLWKMTIADDNTIELTRAVLNTVLFVAKLLQHDKAILLPQAATVFREYYSPAEDDNDVYLEVRDGFIKFSTRWLMNQLILYLQPYMGYRCVVDRLGTLLYPRNGDIMKTLSLALFQSPIISTSPKHDQHKQPCSTKSKAALLNEAANVINDIILEEIQRHRQCSVDLTTFNLDDHIKDMNPLLWQFITLCTRSFRERTNRAHSDDTHVKKIRNYFIICMLMFATNACSDTALHLFVADTVEVCGGSRQLLKVLNRLGVSVSADTHDRLVTYVAEEDSPKFHQYGVISRVVQTPPFYLLHNTGTSTCLPAPCLPTICIASDQSNRSFYHGTTILSSKSFS